MSTAGDLKKREDQATAGNAADGLDRAQQDYDNKFNKIANASENEDFDDIIDHNFGDNAPDEIDVGGDKVARNYNADEPEDSREDVANQEENPDSLYNNERGSRTRRGFLGRLGRAKKFGATGGIVGLLLMSTLGIGGGMTTLFSTALINLKEILHSDNAKSPRANELFSRASLSAKLGGKSKNGDSCGKIAIKCKMSTFSDEEIRSYRRAGFQLEGDQIGSDGKPTGKSIADIYPSDADLGTAPPDAAKGDFRVKNITFPDGTSVGDGASFWKYTAANVKMRLSSTFAFNPKSFFYDSPKFQKILSAFHFDKGTAFGGNDKKQLDDNFNKESGGNTAQELEDPKFKETQKETEKSTLGSKVTAKVKRAASAVGALSAACTAYNVSHLIVTAAKTERIIRLIQFALPWLQAADQIKNAENNSTFAAPASANSTSSTPVQDGSTAITADKVNYLGDRLMASSTTDKNDPRYGLSAFDSSGYMAAMGGVAGLTDFAKKYLLGGDGGIVKQIDDANKSVEQWLSQNTPIKSKQDIRLACKFGNGTLGQIVGLLGCLPEAATGIGAILTAVCVAGGQAAGELLSKLLEHFLPQIVQAIVDLHLGSDLVGVDAGNAIAAGAGVLLSTTDSGFGLTPSQNASQLQQYTAYTQPIDDQYTEVARLDAQSRPFDIYDQYSFLGSIVDKVMGPQDLTTTPGFGSFYNVFRIMGAALTSFSPVASAEYSQPSNIAAQRYTNCTDEDLKSIGVIGDAYCNIVDYMPQKELTNAMAVANGDTSSIDNNLDYMLNPQTKAEPDGGTYDETCPTSSSEVEGPTTVQTCTDKSKLPSINPDGSAVEGSQYSKFLTYCTDNRVTGDVGAYWGSSSESIEAGSDKDQMWYSGQECLGNSDMLYNFRTYTAYCQSYAAERGLATCTDSPSTTTTGAALSQSTAGICGLVDNPNIVFVNPATKDDLKQNCAGQPVTNVCGQPMMLDSQLANTMNTLSSKYKVYVNNFGFQNDRHDCDTGYHPKGKAVDLNGIQEIGGGAGGSTDWGSIKYSDPAQVKVVNDYATDWMATLPPNGGGVGQKQCGVSPKWPSGAVNVNGAALFDDECSHLHIDVRSR